MRTTNEEKPLSKENLDGHCVRITSDVRMTHTIKKENNNNTGRQPKSRCGRHDNNDNNINDDNRRRSIDRLIDRLLASVRPCLRVPICTVQSNPAQDIHHRRRILPRAHLTAAIISDTVQCGFH